MVDAVPWPIACKAETAGAAPRPLRDRTGRTLLGRIRPSTLVSADRQLDFHPGIGMRWEITRSTEDTAGELFEATNWVDPRMPGPPVHVHPTAEESYEVLEGAIEVFMTGEWSAVRAGEKATVPEGVPHSLRNASDEPARIVNIHKAAQRF